MPLLLRARIELVAEIIEEKSLFVIKAVVIRGTTES